MIATALSIRNYVSSDQPYFEALNREWIELLFEMEAVDIQILRHPEEYIIAKGGCLLTATYNDRVVGTVALKLVSRGRYELTKLAVDKEFRGQRIGLALVEAAIDKAKMLRADAIVLYSVRKLKPAITLYRKLGFIEVPVDPLYKRSDIKMELKLNQHYHEQVKMV